jgi:hypothetical protein
MAFPVFYFGLKHCFSVPAMAMLPLPLAGEDRGWVHPPGTRGGQRRQVPTRRAPAPGAIKTIPTSSNLPKDADVPASNPLPPDRQNRQDGGHEVKLV